MITYTVIIKRINQTKFEDFCFGKYHWEVKVYETEDSVSSNWELGKSGITYSIKRCKKKSLKHIIKTDKGIKDGLLQFGVVFDTSGDIELMKEVLK